MPFANLFGAYLIASMLSVSDLRNIYVYIEMEVITARPRNINPPLLCLFGFVEKIRI